MRNRLLLAVLGILALLPVNLSWGQANLPNNANATTVQGPDPTGMLGYPLATVPATGALPWPVAIQSFAASLAVTQGTNPWLTDNYGPLHQASGILAITGDTVSIATGNCGSVSVCCQTSGTWSGQIFFEATTDNSHWGPIAGRTEENTLGIPVSGAGLIAFISGQTVGTSVNLQFGVSGYVAFRVRGRAVNSGTCTISLNASTSTVEALPYMAAVTSTSYSSTVAAVSNLYLDILNNNTHLPVSLQVSNRSLNTNVGAWAPITYSFPMLGASGFTANEERTPDNFKTVATAAAGNTALWTPAAGKKFRLMRYMVTVTDQATQAGAGTLTCSLFDGAAGVTGQVHDIFVPALGLVNTGSLYSSGWIDLGNGYLSTAANNVLNINLSAALTAGTVRVICCGTEE